MSSFYKSGVVEEGLNSTSPIPLLCHDDIESFFAEQREDDIESFFAVQREVAKEVKLSYMLQRFDDTFSTEDRWPI